MMDASSIENKQDAILNETIEAKKKYDLEKNNLHELNMFDFDDDMPEINELRHELKLVIQLLNQAKFDDVIHLISNPSRFLSINFVVGFTRGLAFGLALIILGAVVVATLVDSPLF